MAVMLHKRVIRLGVFDLDGVLLDFIKMFPKYCEVAAERAGFPVEPLRQHFSEIFSGIRDPAGDAMSGARRVWPTHSDEAHRRYVAYMREEERRSSYPLIPGSIALLEWLRGQDVLLALCTNNDVHTLAHRLETSGLLGWFSAMNTTDHEYYKPHPRALLRMVEEMGLSPAETFYVGDQPTDVLTAQAADIPFFAVRSGGVPQATFVRHGVPVERILEDIDSLRVHIEVL